MKSLFIDTSNAKRLAVIEENGKILAKLEENNDTELSSRMLPMIAEAFKNASIEPNDIDTIYIVNGPGSFTGIRIGVTIAKVYAWSLKKKIVPISELELMASTKNDADLVIPYIDARRDYAFSGIYDNNLNTIKKDSYISKEELLKEIDKNKSIVFVSYDKVDLPFPILEPNPDILKVISKHKNDSGVNPHECNPNYLKDTEAEEKLREGKLNVPGTK